MGCFRGCHFVPQHRDVTRRGARRVSSSVRMSFHVPPLPFDEPGAPPLDLPRLLQHLDMDVDTVLRHADVVLPALAERGRFEAVRLLLDAGADDVWLPWTALMTAVAVGTVDDVRRALDAGGRLEEADWRDRTPWLLAAHAGDVAKAVLLRERGTDVSARGWCGAPAIFHAIEAGRVDMLRWLIAEGQPLADTDEDGCGPLAFATERGAVGVAAELLARGVGADEGDGHLNALWLAASAPVVRLLLDAGASPGELSAEGRRSLVRLPPDTDESALDAVPRDAVQRTGLRRRFGDANPTPMDDPFLIAMIRAGVSAYRAGRHFRLKGDAQAPIWSAQRFGQSVTLLPDGRIVQIGGEHEDSYDPDFCIYNDVFVHHPDGRIEVFGYPEDVFPPTDFHSATRVGGTIWVIGGLGYGAARRIGETPVHRLDLATWRFDRVATTGPAPGWLHDHQTRLTEDGRALVVRGGKALVAIGEKRDTWADHTAVHRLDTGTGAWSRDA